MGRIDKVHHVVVPLHGLQQQEDSQDKYCPFTPFADNKQKDTDHTKQQQDISRRKERCIQGGKTTQQEQTPEKTVTEIFPFLLLIGILYVER